MYLYSLYSHMNINIRKTYKGSININNKKQNKKQNKKNLSIQG